MLNVCMNIYCFSYTRAAVHFNNILAPKSDWQYWHVYQRDAGSKQTITALPRIC